MGFLIIGKGFYDKVQLLEQLNVWGIENPLLIIKQAERGKAICGEHQIFAIR